MALYHFAGQYRDLLPDQIEAYLDLTIPRFLELAHPNATEFGRFFGVVPGTAEYDEKWSEITAQARQISIANAIGQATISILYTRAPAGQTVMLAGQQIIRGSGTGVIAQTIGKGDSSVPSHRMLRGFHYPRTAGFDPDKTTEAEIAEFTRLVVADRETVLTLVADGALTPGEGQLVLQRGMQAMLGAAFCLDQEIAPAPVTYITNTRIRVTQVLARLGMHWEGLFDNGAEPTARMLQPDGFNRPYWEWKRHVGPHVPPAILGQGVAAAVGYLGRNQPRVLAKLPLSLPFMLPITESTRATLARWRDDYCLTEVGHLAATSVG